MLAEQYHKMGAKPFDIKALQCTKSVRDFLCDYLSDSDIVISYAPRVEFGGSTAFQWVIGGWVCEQDKDRRLVAPKVRVNYRVIRSLFDAGFLRVRTDLKPLHVRSVLFSWTKEAQTYQREIIRAHILSEKHGVSVKLVDALAAYYGVKMTYIPSRGLFEILRLTGEPIPKGKSSRTCVLANSEGEPVNRYKDMKIHEWESVIHKAANKAGTLNRPAPLPEGVKSHLSAFIRAT